ncbi:MAG: DUF1697 domain-containing protein [Ferruginibacter sp.]|nr:DUF1697 domain-containing protein [Cytophagales bacterium]
MLRYTAFLRAINVGGHVVKMAHLRTLFTELGFSNVETFIASGNVLFETPVEDPHSLERQIERHLHQSLRYEVATFIRTPSELAAIAHHPSFAPADLIADGSALYIAFLPAPPTAEAQHQLLTFRTPADDFHVHGREVYWLCRKKISESAFSGARLEKTMRMPATMRNATTVRKLVARWAAPG